MNKEEFELRVETSKLTKSQKLVLSILRKQGENGVTPKQLLGEVPFAARTVRYALRRLLKKNLIKRIPCLQDMRQWIYLSA